MGGVPGDERDDAAFQAYFEALLRGSVLKSAERKRSRHHARGNTYRARREDRRVEGIRDEPLRLPTAGSRPRGPVVVLTSLAWVACVALLIAALFVFGLHSWTTSVADGAVIAATFGWFAVSVRGSV